MRSRARGELDTGELLIEPGSRVMSGSTGGFGLSPVPKVRLPYAVLKTVHTEKPKDEHEEKVAKRSEESKENVIKAESRSKGMNTRKKGRGKKIKTSSNIAPQFRTPVTSVSMKV